MKIMVIDREALTNQLIASKLEAKGHDAITFENKNEAFAALRDGSFDCVFVDPLPLAEAKPVVFAVWRAIPQEVKPYIMLLTKNGTTEDAIQAGTNDVINKPLDAQDMFTKLENASRLVDISRHLSLPDDSVSSGNGMIDKNAFHQLYLSAADRAFRYGERSMIVFIHVSNYDELLDDMGEDMLEETIQKLIKKMTYMRRQSDVIGRIGKQDFAILLQRPQEEHEPIDAIDRFSEVLNKFHEGFFDPDAAPKLELDLIEVPQGALLAERFIPTMQIEMSEGDIIND